MKYPQLVSPRAVNAISDWLVSRLELLGVESPQIYTRLLLSLLQSSVQVNDPIEFSNLEAFFASRKGGHRRFHLPSDTETLKKLNAVQCLREIVSNEQETATIEHLVEELCEKLKDIERQTQNFNDEQQFLIESSLNNDSLLQAQINLQLQQQQQHQYQEPSSSSVNNQHNSRHHQHHNNNNNNHQPSSHICNNSHNTTLSHNNSGDSKHYNASTTTATATTADAVNDIDNDPKNRYFRAFPALSKEMEDSFRIWRRNAKSFTWPIVGRAIQSVDNSNNNPNNNNNNNNSNSTSLSSSSASSIISSSNFGIVLTSSADKGFEKKVKAEGASHPNQLVNKVSAETTSANISGSGCVSSGDVQQHQAVGAAASAKKKSKRRRNQALCKGKNIQSVRKLSAGNTSNSVGSNKYHHYSHHRNTSPTWDTDFKGCWEMGPDLIKEFLTRQNNNSNKRNRSDSNSMEQEEQIERKISNEISSEHDKPVMKRHIDLSFCCDDDDDNNTQRLYSEEGVDYVDTDYDDNTLTSIPELAMDSINPKRLYQREGHLQKLVVGNVLVGNIENDSLLDGTSGSVDPIDFQQFKAKFTSSVEALWKDAESSNSVNIQPAMMQAVNENAIKVNNSDSGIGISSNFYATTSLNALAPFKKDLWNFWSNYNQQQHYDQKLSNKLSTTTSTSSMITTRLEDSSASSGAGADIANSSDYFSMPSNLDDFDKSVGGVRRTNDAPASLDAHTPSINVFLQNSIWSTSGDCVDAIGTSSTADTDESFLIKVWHSNKKLSQLDVGHSISGEKMTTTADGGGELDYIKSKESSILNNPNLGANLQFPPYQNLKWSEGINAGPSCNSLHSNANIPNSSTLQDENNYANFSSAADISGATWAAPAYGQSAQPDLKSWCASNPMSLTEMYGSDVCDSIVNQTSSEDSEQNSADVNIGPAVTLPNHSADSSGFVAYARVKQCGIVKPQTKPLQTSNALRLPKDFFRSGEEEENLLTSERTRFRPIENFVDGHTFEISNALDSVDFERTESGLLFYDSEEYLEYTRNDIYMADEEVSTSSTNLLKYGKIANEDKSDTFVIKFRVRRSEEMACQTEEQYFELAAAKMIEIPTSSANLSDPTYFPQGEVANMFHNTFSLSRQANNEAIMAAVTKAVAAAAKAAAENHLNSGHFSWLHPAHTSTAVTSSNCTIENNPIWMTSDASVCDEVDFCKANSLNQNLNYGPSVKTTDACCRQQQEQLAQNWTMQEVEKQCHQRRYLPQMPQQHQHELKRKFPTSVDLERSEENSLDNTSLHTLWGMCAACNSCEYSKSMPANRLLRDELQLEADEIMSDLRYMQDLYIGESNVVTDTNENNGEDLDDTDYKMEGEENSKLIKNPWNADNDNVQVSVLQKVNRLIEDLLKPDNAVKLPIETEPYDNLNKETGLSNVWNLQNENAQSRNLWQYCEENANIWQHKPSMEQQDGKAIEQSKTLIKPMKLLQQVRGSLTEDSQYMDTLNWEHENLAKIWQDEITSATSKEMKNEQQSQHGDEIKNADINEALQKEEEEEKEFMKGSQKLVEENNLRNLQNINTLTPLSSAAACPSYERVQHFLNNSAAKLKLVANRKRRHSASQNFYQQQQRHLNYTNNGSNNNNDNITDLNVYKQQLNDALKDTKDQQEQQHQEQQQQFEATPCKIDTKNNNLDDQPKGQTIITCKYWTTATNGTQSSLDSAAAAMMLLAAATKVDSNADSIYNADDVMLDENIFGNTFSCLIDKNASILKHMTMMTRPLTR